MDLDATSPVLTPSLSINAVNACERAAQMPLEDEEWEEFGPDGERLHQSSMILQPIINSLVCICNWIPAYVDFAGLSTPDFERYCPRLLAHGSRSAFKTLFTTGRATHGAAADGPNGHAAARAELCRRSESRHLQMTRESVARDATARKCGLRAKK